ncbi:hypothetical protein BGX26_008798 [Mortierella sp. AD094]|nr:hypothetical protein BGX26_008798 [Mortierella sp. AD094]
MNRTHVLEVDVSTMGENIHQSITVDIIVKTPKASTCYLHQQHCTLGVPKNIQRPLLARPRTTKKYFVYA